jgi:hypothetical protein
VYRAAITDAGLKEGSDFKTLTGLGLSRTPVANAGLKELTKLTSLSLLITKVTKEGAAELQKALPKCTIFGP